MTKKEFLHRMETEKISLREYIVVVDRLSDGPYVIGCHYEEGVWIIYTTGERGGYYGGTKIEDENEAFDHLYRKVKLQESYVRNSD
ncbi:MAG: hypothetical protein R3Y54_10660, partial [Eubacteriales bacterium]